MPYSIHYSSEAEEHLRGLTARQQAVVLDRVNEQLPQQPTVQTRNRKPMRGNPIATWELRVGNIRVYYEVEEEPEQMVLVVAIGIKVGNRVYIAGEEVHW